MQRALIIVVVALGACGGDEHGAVADADDAVDDALDVAADSDVDTSVDTVEDVDAPPSPGSFRWDLAAVRPDDFYAYPWPSARRTTATGAPDLAAFSTERARTSILDDAVHAVENGPPGFSPLASAYFGLTVDLDPATLDGNVLLVDMDTHERLSATAEWNGPGGGYWPARTLAVHADYQLPPRAGARIAAVLLKGLRTIDGAPLVPPDEIVHLGEDDCIGEGVEQICFEDPLEFLYPSLPALGLTRGDLLAWTVWRASDPMADLRALADHIHREGGPETLGDIALVARNDGWDHYEGKMSLLEAFSGDPPYTTPFGAGLIRVTADGSPATPRRVTVPFTLTVPTSAMPADGYPLVLYGHGLGETHEGFLRTAAAPCAARGIAVIGLDPPLQGTRNTTGLDDRTLVVQLSVGNIVGGRELLRQGVYDYLQLAHGVARPGFVVPADVAPDGAELRFDPKRLGYFGHSEGAQIGALLLPLAPTIGPAVLSEGGGGAAITMLVLKLQEIDVSATVAQFLGVDLDVERWVLGHPLVTAVIQPLLDSADPLYGARQILREPLPGGVAHDVAMLEGFLDPLTPPASIEALASAMGLPIAEPVGRAIAGLTAQHIAPTPLPASGNLPTVPPAPAPDARTPTGALLQMPDEDHYIIYFRDDVEAQLVDFLASAFAGHATIAPLPPAPAPTTP